MPSYNFDVIQGGLTYAIDVTKPPQQRIGDLEIDGKPVAERSAFIVVTNNYRASGGGRFPGLDGSNIVLSAPDANRDVLISYIRNKKNITREQFADARNWKFAKTKTAGPMYVHVRDGQTRHRKIRKPSCHTHKRQRRRHRDIRARPLEIALDYQLARALNPRRERGSAAGTGM